MTSTRPIHDACMSGWQQGAEFLHPGARQFPAADRRDLMRNRIKRSWAFGWLTLLLAGSQLRAAEAAAPTPDSFDQSIRPLLSEYCVKCHSTEKHKGDLDLERFTSLEAVRTHPQTWQRAMEQIVTDEMPPKDKPQPSPQQREQLLKWISALLDDIALSRAGDPGPVVLRRLSNAEYNYTIRDLTGLESIDPTREFPADSASGEGFMNVGNSLVMSPSLVTKYLDAGKEVAGHLILLPDEIRFSPSTTRRDWTEELLGEIRRFYDQFTLNGGGLAVNLQGIKFDTQDGGVLPLEQYLAALLEERAQNGSPRSAPAGLSTKYLRLLRYALNSRQPSLLLDPIRARWRAARPGDAAALTQAIAQWQHALWKFNPVGHIGRTGGPQAWMDPVSPLTSRQELRLKVRAAPEAKEVVLYLAASDAGDGSEGDYVVWEQPRFVAPGRPNLLLRDVRGLSHDLSARRERLLATTATCLEAATEAELHPGKNDVIELARKYDIESGLLSAWLNYLGIGSGGPAQIEHYFTNRLDNTSGYEFIQGWGSPDTPSLVANSSAQHVRIPGNMKPHSVAVHPSPSSAAVVGWRSPLTTTLRVEATIQHAHPECGNGVTWSLELRRGATRQRLSTGITQGGTEVKSTPISNLAVQPGDLISVLIGPRDGNHSCDLTAVDLVLTSEAEGGREWDLARDVSPNVLAGNPHPDRFGHEDVWHFYVEPDQGGPLGPVIPAGSLLARWQTTPDVQEKRRLAKELQTLLTSIPPTHPADLALYRQIVSLGGPLFSGLLQESGWRSATPPELQPQPARAAERSAATALSPAALDGGVGLDPAQFGTHPNGSALDATSLCVQAPSLIELRLPADLVDGCEFVTTGILHQETGAEGSVQLELLAAKPGSDSVVPRRFDSPELGTGGAPSHVLPIVVNADSAALRRIEAALDEYREIFPAALCYTKIVPVDEVVTLTLFYREDQHLRRLMLDEAQVARLDRLWDELHYVSHDALTLVTAYEQLTEFATQDRPDLVVSFAPLRQPINDRANSFRQRLLDTEPEHLEGVVEFAYGAYRRPLDDDEKKDLRNLYVQLREQDFPHDEAIRLTLARVLVSPAFLYRAELPGPGSEPGPVNDWELATRLSYFLWSSAPDAELLEVAARGRLHEPDVLAAQTRRMLKDKRVRRLATEFACAWLHIHSFDTLDEKSERHFPSFAGLRGAMYEESIQFFTDFFQHDRSVLSILDSDHTFLNGPLAEHYGIPGVTGPAWRRVDRLKAFSRGGILGQAATLAKQSGASRTSPILRGNWVAEVLLGEKLPRPPKDVPQLPEDESATEGFTVRQLVERHSSDPSCSGCHVRIDPYGYALEAFDAIGRFRERDLGDRPIDTRTKVMDGSEIDGLEGLRDYLLTQRRDAFLHQFCRKLLGYALGRGVLLSDRPLLNAMRHELNARESRITAVIDMVVGSRQFREIRGKEMVDVESTPSPTVNL